MSTRPEPPRRRTAVRRTTGKGAAAPAAPVRSGLTTRAAVLALVVCALVVSAALPLREYLSSRGNIATMEAAQRAQRTRVTALEQQQARLQEPAYVRSQARLRLHFVLPGETSYVLLDPGAKPPPATRSPATADATSPGATSPWYSQVWGSVQAADRPAARTAP